MPGGAVCSWLSGPVWTWLAVLTVNVLTPKMAPGEVVLDVPVHALDNVITAMRKVMPMITPTSVNTDFSLWAQICCRAMRMPSRILTTVSPVPASSQTVSCARGARSVV